MPDVPEPKVIQGHPSILWEPEQGPPEPHWRPWGIKYKAAKRKPVVVYLCAECGSLKQVLFLSKDRWICTVCRNEGTERPTFVPISRP